jgi:hypothetical protein
MKIKYESLGLYQIFKRLNISKPLTSNQLGRTFVASNVVEKERKVVDEGELPEIPLSFSRGCLIVLRKRVLIRIKVFPTVEHTHDNQWYSNEGEYHHYSLNAVCYSATLLSPPTHSKMRMRPMMITTGYAESGDRLNIELNVPCK